MEWLVEILKILAVAGILLFILKWLIYDKVRYRMKKVRVVIGKNGGAGTSVVIEPLSPRRNVVINDPARTLLLEGERDQHPIELKPIRSKFKPATIEAQTAESGFNTQYVYDPKELPPCNYVLAKVIVKPSGCWRSKSKVVKIDFIPGSYG